MICCESLAVAARIFVALPHGWVKTTRNTFHYASFNGRKQSGIFMWLGPRGCSQYSMFDAR